ncbi:MAG: hypothetical protein HY075_03455 [Deltaproteobacteria bacterium]|nr:hypothetical protein [Deltaproteobacteria bacterium]
MKHGSTFTLLVLLTLAPDFARGADRATPRFRGRIETQRVEKEPTLPADPTVPDFEVRVAYAQSAAAWGTVHDVKTAQGSLPALNEVLKREYGVPEEAVTSFAMSYSTTLSKGASDRVRFAATADGVGYALVQNPVVPELHGDAVAIGTFGGGYSFDAGGVDFGVGAVAGVGREKRIDATSTDLIESIPLRNGAVYLYGADFELARRFRFDRSTAFRLSGSAKETLVETTTPSASAGGALGASSQLFHRWRAAGTLERAVELAFLQRSVLLVEGIAGPQPLPVSVLPRIWDYAHNLYPTPELGAMFGAGLGLRAALSRASRLETHVGYYGGYPGGMLALKLSAVDLTLASWGLENSAAYHVLGERLWQASLGFSL